jgi:hypothetical protein
MNEQKESFRIKDLPSNRCAMRSSGKVDFGRLLLTSLLLIVGSLAEAATTYFVSSAGNDRDDGLTPDTAWKSLAKVSRQALEPGDSVRFRAGDVFEGQLTISSSGTADAPIQITRFGEGKKPLLMGGNGRRGAPVATILVEDQDNLAISGLEIRNFRKRSKDNVPDEDAYGILIRNNGKRSLSGFELHDLVVQDVYPIKRRRMFNRNTVTGIRFETLPPKTADKAVNTSDIFLHANVIRFTGRFGIAVRHRASNLTPLRGQPMDFDHNVRIVNNLCEDLGGSCVLLNGVWSGLLESNTFLRSGSLHNQALSVSRGSGAWFFRSRDIVAQYNAAVGSRGHNDSSGLHVDFGNQNVLVQYNFFYDNEGYGTEILGKNNNVIWRYNVSVGDGTRIPRIDRPEGIKSQYPGKTIFVSDFAAPKRITSSNISIYNNTYVTAEGSSPQMELNGINVSLNNNAFVAIPNSRLGSRVLVVWNDEEGPAVAGNLFSGAVAPAFIALDSSPLRADIELPDNATTLGQFAIPSEYRGIPISHPSFPAAGSGIFSHISEVPTSDIFGLPIDQSNPPLGAGVKDMRQ